jgi:hypothetical protein
MAVSAKPSLSALTRLTPSNHPDSKVRWPSGLRRQLKVVPFVVHQYNRWSERAWVQIPLSSIYLLPILSAFLAASFCELHVRTGKVTLVVELCNRVHAEDCASMVEV